MAEALHMLRAYYGAMLEKGATTFWEDLDMSWLEKTAAIDRLPEEGLRDLHGDSGIACYTGYRHSLCHGWSSAPTAFLAEESGFWSPAAAVLPFVPGWEAWNGPRAAIPPRWVC